MKPDAVGEINSWFQVSVLSVEPWGMKLDDERVEDEDLCVSVLSVEPWGMKPRGDHCRRRNFRVSVLSVEPWGMKQK